MNMTTWQHDRLKAPYFSECLGDAGLDVVGGGAEGLAALGHEAGSKVAQGPVVVHIRPQAQLLAHDTGHHGRDELVQLNEGKKE